MNAGLRTSLIAFGFVLLMTIGLTAWCFTQPAQPAPPNLGAEPPGTDRPPPAYDARANRAVLFNSRLRSGKP